MAWMPNDLEIMQRIRFGDSEALRLLYERYGKAIYSLAFHVLHNSVLAEEVTQDVFLKIWAQRAQWDASKGQFSHWILRTTHFTAIDRWRREQRQPSLDPLSYDEVDESLLTNRSGQPWEDNSLLHLLLTELPREQSQLIDLAFFKGMSHAEIAEHTRIPLGTVKTRLRTGLKQLRELWLDALHVTTKTGKMGV
jgi:RNA polymerase sigma-70 factor (ECF subfamily)